jgi:hypothetical protein
VARPCSICSHPRVSEIDAALMASTAYRRVAKQFEASESSVYRHSREHLPVAGRATSNGPTEPKAEDGVQSCQSESPLARCIKSGDLLGDMVRLQTRTLGILESASAAGRHETALKAIRETRQNIELIAELERLRGEGRGTLDLRHLRPEQIAVLLRAMLGELPERDREELLLEAPELA